MKKDNLNELDKVAKSADETAVTDDNFASAVDKSQDYSNVELNNELERLADTFRSELKKAQAMTEEELIKSGIIIQQYEDDEGVIPQEELCQCCGEQRRDKSFGENYEYCRSCREAMKRYPLSVYSIVLLAATVFIAVVSVFSFAADYNIYNTIRKGDKYLAENKLESAFEEYDNAIASFDSKEIVAKRLYLKTAEIMFENMPNGIASMDEVRYRIETALSQFEISLPLYEKYDDLYVKSQSMYATMNEFYTVMNSEKYADFDGKDQETYEELMAEIGSIIDKQVTVVSVDGESSSLVDSNPEIVRFCQFMFAYSVGKFDDSYKYMREVYELVPSYTWLYAYELGLVELQKGNVEEAKELSEIILSNNIEDPDGYILKSAIARMSGNTREAIAQADEGIKMCPNYTELYRTRAIALIVNGDYKAAKESVKTALEMEEYSFLYMVLMVAENELGNKDNVQEIKDILEEHEVELTEKMEKYLKGKITAKQMFTEGTGDVE